MKETLLMSSRLSVHGWPHGYPPCPEDIMTAQYPLFALGQTCNNTVVNSVSDEELRVVILAFTEAKKKIPDTHESWELLCFYHKELITEQASSRKDLFSKREFTWSIIPAYISNESVEIVILALSTALNHTNLPPTHNDWKSMRSMLVGLRMIRQKRRLPKELMPTVFY